MSCSSFIFTAFRPYTPDCRDSGGPAETSVGLSPLYVASAGVPTYTVYCASAGFMDRAMDYGVMGPSLPAARSFLALDRPKKGQICPSHPIYLPLNCYMIPQHMKLVICTA